MTNQKHKVQNLFIVLIAAATVSACGTSKSNSVNQNNFSSANSQLNSQKQLTNCSSSVNSDIALNINAITDSAGQIDPNWVKIKFNFLSTTATQSGNTVRFFKWKVSGGQSLLDQTPLSSQFYNLTSGQPTATAATSTSVVEISATRGLYLQLNDPSASYQVIKAVVYNSAGQVVSQINSLIPQFNSNLVDYSINSDGSPRAQILIDMHPLKSISTTSWSQASYTNYFQNFCF